jgi:type IV secretory pathway VirB3-like protein
MSGTRYQSKTVKSTEIVLTGVVVVVVVVVVDVVVVVVVVVVEDVAVDSEVEFVTLVAFVNDTGGDVGSSCSVVEEN